MEFCLESPVLKCHQELFNSCYLSILASSFSSIGDNRAANSIEESLTLQTNRISNIIDFANDNMKNKLRR